MTLAGAPLSLLAPVAAGLSAGLVVLYVLKLRRRRVEVPFANLWQRVLRERETTALWRKLRRLLSLVVQLVLLLLILLAVGDPRLAASQSGRSVALLLDTSASMQAKDGAGGRARLEEAKDAARRLVRGLGPADHAMLLTIDGRPAPRTGLTNDDRELLRAIDEVTATDTPGDVAGALRLAADVLRGRPSPELVLISDGAFDDAALARVRTSGEAPAALGEIDLRGVALKHQPVGASGDNVGLTAFAVRRYRANQTAYEVLAELTSFSDKPKTVKLELVQDGEVVEVETIALEPGERVQRLYPNLAGEGTRLEARLETGDVLAVDDHAYALLPPRRKLKVLLVTVGNLFLEGALLLDENLEVEKLPPAAWDAARAARYDAVVLDGFVPPEPPRTHALYLDPRGPHSPFDARGEITAPLVTEVAEKHPLMRWVTLRDLNISRAVAFRLRPGDVAVASSLRQPIVVAREDGGLKRVALGFDIRRSDLPMRVAFPVMVVNALDWFAGADTGLMAAYPTGQPWRLQAPAGVTELEVRGPDGQHGRAPVHDGRATFYGSRAGYYEARSAAGAWSFAANLQSPVESRVQPRTSLTVSGHALEPPTPGRLGLKRALWPYLVALALVICLIEWWTYNRRVTV